MALITTTDKPMFYAAQEGGNTVFADITQVGDATGIRNTYTVIQSDDENTFLQAAQGSGATFTPLPIAGTWLNANEIYAYNGDLVIVRQSHTRTTHEPSEVPALFLTYRAEQTGALEWVANESVLVGVERTYNGVTYICIQAHVTQFTPDLTPALWQVVPTTAEWTIGVAYAVNDIVTYNGIEYRCLQAHTALVGWQPPNVPALWVVV